MSMGSLTLSGPRFFRYRKDRWGGGGGWWISKAYIYWVILDNIILHNRLGKLLKKSVFKSIFTLEGAAIRSRLQQSKSKLILYVVRRL